MDFSKKLWYLSPFGCTRYLCSVPFMKYALSVALTLMVVLCQPERPQAAPDFRDKTITIYVAAPAGGGFDLMTRLLAHHLGAHILGNPTVIVSDMPGAHGITGANYLFNLAPKDGTALGAPVPYIAQFQVQGIAGVEFDASRFGWLGSVSTVNEIMYVWHTVPVRSIEDLRRHEVILAADSRVETFARLLTATIGARFKLVKGYAGTKGVHLALERGEVEGAVSSLPVLRASWPDWLTQRKVRIILINAFARDPDLPDAPATYELAKTQADRDLMAFFIASTSVGRTLIAPPGVPPATLATLRTAFAGTLEDPAFIAECRQVKFEIAPRSGEDVQKMVSGMVGIDARTRARVRAIAGDEL
jgi:tripartite-type tricarboxylate transporter receptor subunit TctC